MRKLIVSLLIGMMAFYGTPFAFGASFNFEGIDNWGLGRAAMNIYIIGNLLTVEINNHSPIALNSPYTTPKDGFNVPGITGFGFEFLPQAVDMNSWILESYYFSGNGIKQSVIIGSNDETKIGPGPKEGRWTYFKDSKWKGFALSDIFSTEQGIQGALYNPEARNLQGLAPFPWFTTTKLTATLNQGDAYLDLDKKFSPFVRMQNVGYNQKGSLKLSGDPTGGGGGGEVPEPGTLFLIGSGLVGFAVLRKKYRKIDTHT